MKQALTFLTFLLVINVQANNSNTSSNENKGTIQGTVIDKNLEEALPYVTIAVEDKDGTIVTGGITDEEGKFNINSLSFGSYQVKIQYIGYTTFTKEIEISSANSTIDMGTIALEENIDALDEVTVVAERSTIVQKVDRKVINVGKDLATTGASASEIMNNVPSVNVDQDGNISLRGNENVRILIDGKPTNIDAAQLLKQIPSTSIKSIELITNPSAKYNPEGMSGIINIVLHKNTNNGLNGAVNLGLTQGENTRLNNSLNLNYRQGKFNFYGNYGFNTGKFSNVGDIRKFDNPDTPDFDEASREKFDLLNDNTSHLLKFGVDYFIDDKNTLSVYTNKNLYDGRMNSNVDVVYFTENMQDVEQFTQMDTDNTSDTYNLAYKHVFAKEGHEIQLEADYNTYTGENEALFNYPTNEESNYQDRVNNDRENTTINVDYTNPLSENSKLELGAETRLQQTDNTYTTTAASLNDASFYYNRDILSAYATFSQNFEKWSYQLGARVENYSVDALFEAADAEAIPFTDEILTVYPSAFLSYNLNEKSTLQASYSRRVDRPGLEQINPIREFSTPQITSQGNQQLEPQFTNSIEMNYSRQLEKGNFSGGVFYRRIQDEISRTVEQDPLDPARVILTFNNFDDNNAYGVEFSGAYRPTKWWNFNASFDLYQRTLKGVLDNTNVEVDNTMYTFRMNNSFKATKHLTFQLFGFYRGPSKSIQFNSQEFYFMNAGFRYNVLQDQGTISVNFNDVFDTQRSIIDADRPVPMEGEFKWESRTVYLGLSYRFGGGKSKTMNRKQRDNNEKSDSEGLF